MQRIGYTVSLLLLFMGTEYLLATHDRHGPRYSAKSYRHKFINYI